MSTDGSEALKQSIMSADESMSCVTAHAAIAQKLRVQVQARQGVPDLQQASMDMRGSMMNAGHVRQDVADRALACVWSLQEAGNCPVKLLLLRSSSCNCSKRNCSERTAAQCD